MFDHFREAQDPIYSQVIEELRGGKKQGHWMWFIFPQIAGLGSSEMSVLYSLADLEAAIAYADDATLGQRLRECCTLANAVKGLSAIEVFGAVDSLKLQSSLTLFLLATKEPVFQFGLAKYFRGEMDPKTVEIVG